MNDSYPGGMLQLFASFQTANRTLKHVYNQITCSVDHSACTIVIVRYRSCVPPPLCSVNSTVSNMITVDLCGQILALMIGHMQVSY